MSQENTKSHITAIIGALLLIFGLMFFIFFHHLSTEYIVLRVISPHNPRLEELEDFIIWEITAGAAMIAGLLLAITCIIQYYARKESQ
ncbi:MAG: hypothetical protein QXR62_06225 [Candidatus Bathyarchaeia archaeon]